MRSTTRLAAVAMTAAALAAPSAAADEPGIVRLAGAPEQVGRVWGEINREAIRRDVEAGYRRRAVAAGISEETLLERSAAFMEIAGQIAPHWLEEARAAARAAGVCEDLFIAYIDGVVRDRFLHEWSFRRASTPAIRKRPMPK